MFFKQSILKNILFSTIFFISNFIFSQQNHYNFWNRVAISNSFSKKYKAEIEVQNRWQNDIYSKDKIWFEDKLMNSFRLWNYYQANDKICIVVSPFAYFENSPIIKNEGDENKVVSYENRYSVLLEIKETFLKKIVLINKIGLEYRDFKNSSPDYFRFREKIGFKYELNSKWSLLTYDELFMNANDKNGNHIFDQNRIGLSVNFNAIKNLKFEVGYMFNNRSQRNSSTNLQENNLLINTYYTLPNKKI